MGPMAEAHEQTDAGGSGLDPACWVERHGSAMFAFASLRLPSADLAEEAVQEALVSAWRSRESFEGRSTERTWLIGILRYKVLDLLRERARGMGTLDETGDVDPAAGTATGAGTAGPDWWSDPDADTMRRMLRDGLGELPEPMRTALVLREVDGIPGKTVCEILGVSETNLWTMIHRAKSRLRRSFSEKFGEPEEDLG